MMRSCSATWCTQAVWSRLATRLRCVSTTPLGNPVVPLEYGSTARSCAGSTRARGAAAPVSSSAANGVAPVAFPRTKISSIPTCRAAGAARSMNAGTVTRNRARASRSWYAASCTVQTELTVVTTPAAASVPWKARANSGQLGTNRPSTSPFSNPRLARPAATRSTPAPSCAYVSVRPLGPSISAGLPPSCAALASTKRCNAMSGTVISGCGLLKVTARPREQWIH